MEYPSTHFVFVLDRNELFEDSDTYSIRFDVRQAILDIFLPVCGQMAKYVARTTSGYRCTMASPGFPSIMAVEELEAKTGAATDKCLTARPDTRNAGGQYWLGCTQNPWRTAETGYRSLSGNGV